MYRKFFVYVDDGNGAIRIAIPAVCDDSARIQCEGSGEVVAVRDVTEDFPISLDKVSQALRAGNFGEAEIYFITRLLAEFGIAE